MAIPTSSGASPEGRWYRRLTLVFLVGTCGYTALGQFWPVREGYRPLAPLGPRENPGLAMNPVPPNTRPLRLNTEKYFSWRGSGPTLGSAATAWHQPTEDFGIFVAGFPKTGTDELAVEIEFRSGAHKAVPIDAANVREEWQFRPVRIGPVGGAVRMRIVSMAGSGYGWVGFSEPVKGDEIVPLALESVLRIVLAILASVTFLLGPGILLRGVLATDAWSLPLIWIPVPGVLLMTAWGILIWLLRLNHLPDLLWTIAYGIEAVFSIAYIRCRNPIAPSPDEKKVLVLFLVVVAVACSKGLYSPGPIGELYYGTVSRTTEVGDRSDSRVPFHIVQLVANGLPLDSAPSRALFAPYFPTSRGPVAGLMASPITLLSGAAVPIVEMDQPWLPFDSEGFTAYRIFMVCFAATSLFAFYSVAETISTSSQLSLLCAAALAVSPFFLHETFFTWPKLAAAAGVLLSFYCVLSRRVVQAGLVLGFAYLIHPLALLSVPPFALLIVIVYMNLGLETAGGPRPAPGKLRIMRRMAPGILRAFAGCLVCAAFFFAWNRLAVGPSQDSTFISYLTSINGKECHAIVAWLKDRIVSISATLIPLYLYVFQGDDFRINSVWGPSPPVVRFYFSYWNTLPFATGIVLFLALFRWMCRVAWRFWAVFAGFVAMPFAVFAIYWGSSDSGLMREGLQPWFLMLFLFAAWAIHQAPKGTKAMLRLLARIQPLRVIELLGMLLIPSLLTRHEWISHRFALTDVLALTVMVLGSSLLGAMARKEALIAIGPERPKAANLAGKPSRRRVR